MIVVGFGLFLFVRFLKQNRKEVKKNGRETGF